MDKTAKELQSLEDPQKLLELCDNEEKLVKRTKRFNWVPTNPKATFVLLFLSTLAFYIPALLVNNLPDLLLLVCVLATALLGFCAFATGVEQVINDPSKTYQFLYLRISQKTANLEDVQVAKVDQISDKKETTLNLVRIHDGRVLRTRSFLLQETQKIEQLQTKWQKEIQSAQKNAVEKAKKLNPEDIIQTKTQ